MHVILLIIGTILVVNFFSENAVVIALLYLIYLVMASIFFLIEKSNYLKKEVIEWLWHGAMSCSSCGYNWQSRRGTPPAKCAACGSKSISTVKVSKVRIEKVKKSEISIGESEELSKLEINTKISLWYKLSVIFGVAVVVYLISR